MVGPYALPDQTSHSEDVTLNEPLVGWIGVVRSPRTFNTRKTTIYGGSNEIQKNIIAKAILAL